MMIDWIEVPSPPDDACFVLDAASRAWSKNGDQWVHKSMTGNTLIANNWALLLAYYGPLRVMKPEPVTIPGERLDYGRLLKVYSQLRSETNSGEKIVSGMLDFITEGRWPGEREGSV